MPSAEAKPPPTNVKLLFAYAIATVSIAKNRLFPHSFEDVPRRLTSPRHSVVRISLATGNPSFGTQQLSLRICLRDFINFYLLCNLLNDPAYPMRRILTSCDIQEMLIRMMNSGGMSTEKIMSKCLRMRSGIVRRRLL